MGGCFVLRGEKGEFRLLRRVTFPHAGKVTKRALEPTVQDSLFTTMQSNPKVRQKNDKFCSKRIGLLLVPLPLVQFSWELTHKFAKKSLNKFVQRLFYRICAGRNFKLN